jgi:hypothetical protein
LPLMSAREREAAKVALADRRRVVEGRMAHEGRVTAT